MNFRQNKDALNRELEQFIATLNELLPRYSKLLRKPVLSNDELGELGDIEYFLLEVNTKISEIKNMLEHDLFGHSLDTYYKLKREALEGEVVSQLKYNRMRESFVKSLNDGGIINWN